jgi:hypothetical protein
MIDFIGLRCPQLAARRVNCTRYRLPLSCMLLAAKYNDIEVWRIITVKSENVYDQAPYGESLVYHIVFGQDEDY